MTDGGAPQPSTGGLTGFWRRRSWKGKTAIVASLVLLVLIVAGALATTAEDENEAAATQPPLPPAAQPPSPPPGAGVAPPRPRTRPPPPQPPGGEPDTGRLSDTEFEQFQRVNKEVADESSQFSEEVRACAQIGTAGDLAGFRACIDDAYSGFEEDAETAHAVAQATLTDAAKGCQAALNSYLIVLETYAAQLRALHESAAVLQYDRLGAESVRLPKQARRYAKFATNALRACRPK